MSLREIHWVVTYRIASPDWAGTRRRQNAGNREKGCDFETCRLSIELKTAEISLETSSHTAASQIAYFTPHKRTLWDKVKRFALKAQMAPTAPLSTWLSLPSLHGHKQPTRRGLRWNT
jgi:hypothetical protein